MRGERRGRLEIGRTRREEDRKLASEKEKEEEEERRIAAEKDKAEEDRRHADDRKAVEEYHEQLGAEKAARAEAEAAAAAAEERDRLDRMLANDERVTYRTILGKERVRQLQHEAAERDRAEREKEERLQRLAETVPYYQAMIDAKADLSKMTVARENDVYVEDGRGLLDFQIGAGKMRSFTNEKVFSDVRFRLGVALHAAGISQTAAARDIVKRLVPREAERTTGIKPF